MKKNILCCFLTLLLVGIIGINPATTSADTTKWKLQSFTASGSNIWKNHLEPFAKLIKERTQGQLDITLYAPGAIVPGFKVTSSVGAGIVEAGLTSPGYDGGTIPESYVLTGLPFAFFDILQQMDFWYTYKGGAAFKIVTDAYNQKKVMPISLLSFPDEMVIMTQFPVRTFADFKGKKIRCTGAHAGAVEALGAVPTSLSIMDVYTALQTGVIDGHFMALSGLEDFGWKDVVKYIVMPAWMPNSPSLLEVNLNAWNKLPDNLKKVVIDTAREVNIKNLIPGSEAKHASIENTITKAGIKIQTLTGDEAVKYKAATAVLWSQAEEKSSTNSQLVKMLKDYLTDKGIDYPGK